MLEVTCRRATTATKQCTSGCASLVKVVDSTVPLYKLAAAYVDSLENASNQTSSRRQPGEKLQRILNYFLVRVHALEKEGVRINAARAQIAHHKNNVTIASKDEQRKLDLIK